MGIDKAVLFEFLLRQGDNTLVLGHRTSQWCGVGPVLEEDIALANTALDLIGQTQLWLGYAAEVQDESKTANDLAFLRDVYDFRNLLLLEVPNGNFGQTITRQYLFDAYQVPWLNELQSSKDQRVADIAAKSLKEALYHLERSSETVIALGDGTEESHQFMQAAVDYCWPYAGEMFCDDATDESIDHAGIAPLPSSIRAHWMANIESVLNEATLAIPDNNYPQRGGRDGVRHTEHLGHMLATMQVLQRSYPGVTW